MSSSISVIINIEYLVKFQFHQVFIPILQLNNDDFHLIQLVLMANQYDY